MSAKKNHADQIFSPMKSSMQFPSNETQRAAEQLTYYIFDEHCE